MGFNKGIFTFVVERLVMEKKNLVVGPTFREMLDPSNIDSKIRKKAIEAAKNDPLDPINLYNITWKDGNNQIYYQVLPNELPNDSQAGMAEYGKLRHRRRLGRVSHEFRLPGDPSGTDE